MATTLLLNTLLSEFLLKILGESTEFVGIWMVQGCKGVGDIPGIRGGSGGSVGSVTSYWIDARTQT